MGAKECLVEGDGTFLVAYHSGVLQDPVLNLLFTLSAYFLSHLTLTHGFKHHLPTIPSILLLAQLPASPPEVDIHKKVDIPTWITN